MRRILLLVLALIPAFVSAGVPFEATAEEMARQADHILVGRVVGLDMVDGQGKLITDPKARTGPGLENTIRLRVHVEQILISTSVKVPNVIPVPLASHLHYTLGQIQGAHKGDSEPRLVLLRGNDFAGIKPGVFMLPLSDKDRVLRVHAASHR